MNFLVLPIGCYRDDGMIWGGVLTRPAKELFGRNLKELMDKIGVGGNGKRVPRKAIADVLHVSESMVNKYRAGINAPEVAKLSVLADYFQVPIARFFHDPDDLKMPPELDAETLSAIVSAAIKKAWPKPPAR
jgi:transcriptional regulator with XRE-family HTH domain